MLNVRYKCTTADILKNLHKLDGVGIIRLLQNQFTTVANTKELQKILLWEISESNTILKKTSQDREYLVERLF